VLQNFLRKLQDNESVKLGVRLNGDLSGEIKANCESVLGERTAGFGVVCYFILMKVAVEKYVCVQGNKRSRSRAYIFAYNAELLSS